MVRSFVARVGHSYSRGTMQGLLASQGINANPQRVRAALERVASIQYAARCSDTNRLLNSLPYQASYFGEKLHLDWNEKCVMLGVTHVVAVDGYSRNIVGFVTIPKKNAIMTQQ